MSVKPLRSIFPGPSVDTSNAAAARSGTQRRPGLRARLPKPWVGLIGLIGLVGVLFAARPARAQDSKIHLESVALDKLPELKSYISIVGADGKTTKTNNGYKLLIDGQEQKDLNVTVTPFSEAKEPIDVVVVVQLSAVMEQALKDIRFSIEKLAKAMSKANKESRIGIVGYGSEVKRYEELGKPSEIARDLDKLTIDPDANEVRMVDAARVGVDLLRENPDRRKILVLFSDGIDAAQGKEVFADLGKRAQQAGVVVHTVGYSPFEAGRLRSLIEISKLSSGTARGCKSTGEIGEKFLQIVDQIYSTNIVVFALTTSGDGNVHKLQVSYKHGTDELMSEEVSVTLPAFEPAEPAGRPLWHYLLIGGGVLLLLVVILGIIGSRMGP